MAKRSRMSVLKRQREMKKAEKAAHKRAKRHGLPQFEPAPEPMPTVAVGEILAGKATSESPSEAGGDADHQEEDQD